MPAHSFKYTAALQAAQTGNAPKIIRIETNAGHGAGKPTSKIIEERSDILAFLANTMKLEVKRAACRSARYGLRGQNALGFRALPSRRAAPRSGMALSRRSALHRGARP